MPNVPALVLCLLACCWPITAGSIDVTGDLFVTIPQGRDLTIQFGVWNYGHNNPGFSPYPTTIGFLALGPPLTDNTPAVQGWLESLDGTVSVPFGSGYLLAMPGAISFGGGTPIDVLTLSGSVSIPLSISEALFGDNFANYNDAAVIRLRNDGLPFTLGLGAPYTVGN